MARCTCVSKILWIFYFGIEKMILFRFHIHNSNVVWLIPSNTWIVSENWRVFGAKVIKIIKKNGLSLGLVGHYLCKKRQKNNPFFLLYNFFILLLLQSGYNIIEKLILMKIFFKPRIDKHHINMDLALNIRR